MRISAIVLGCKKDSGVDLPYMLRLLVKGKKLFGKTNDIIFYCGYSDKLVEGDKIELDVDDYIFYKRPGKLTDVFPEEGEIILARLSGITKKIDLGMYKKEGKTIKEIWKGNRSFILKSVPQYIVETFNILFGQTPFSLEHSCWKEHKEKEVVLNTLELVRSKKILVRFSITKNHILLNCFPNKPEVIANVRDLVLEYLSGDFYSFFAEKKYQKVYNSDYSPLKMAEGSPDYIINFLIEKTDNFFMKSVDLKHLYKLTYFHLSHFITATNSFDLIEYTPVILSGKMILSNEIIDKNDKNRSGSRDRENFDCDEYEGDGNNGNDEDNDDYCEACQESPCACSDRDN